MKARAAHPGPPLRSRVEYLGPDDPHSFLWHGHPGLVIDVPPFEPHEVVVAFVAGPSLCFPAREVRRLDDENYHARGVRLIAGTHPMAKVAVGAPLTAEGSHWP